MSVLSTQQQLRSQGEELFFHANYVEMLIAKAFLIEKEDLEERNSISISKKLCGPFIRLNEENNPTIRIKFKIEKLKVIGYFMGQSLM